MKKLAFLLLLPFTTAQAVVVEKNVAEAKIYHANTPDLNVTVMDLGVDGGFLTVSLDYVGSKAQQEIKDIQSKNPGYTVETVLVEPTDNQTQLEIPEIGLSEKIAIMQGQSGPYINAQLMITAAQMKTLKSTKTELSGLVKLNINVRTSVTGIENLETFKVPGSYCQEFQIKNVSDLILTMGKIKKPLNVRYQQTFDTFKKAVLDNCFSVDSISVSSFSQLLNMQIKKNNISDELVGKYDVSKTRDQRFVLQPRINLIVQ